ncbi:MAG: FKBP-type peptidyl-prolyl cis-trans isomerase [Gemmatimonadetes bacterium]|nr:FKBP-type peptidyl-prolyl cis-trans isomerase [Gemmatimonadota bacterium]NNF37151.1 FKBP-type peptidyl-prolyl cis-trans isomerase [Gemmatimonadota bacterium]
MRHARRPFALVLALVAGLAACDDDVTGPQNPGDVSFNPSLGVDLEAMTELDSGVYIQTLTTGQGVPVVEGDVVVVDYTLWLPDGDEKDSGTDVSFALTPNSVIDGFRLGLLGMLIGETRLIVIPSSLAYGAGGTTGIPPHSVLVFRVTLKDLNPPV